MKEIGERKGGFRGFYLYYVLDINASYYHMQFKGKFMIQTQENGAKPHFCPGSRPLGRNLSRHFFCSKLPSYAVSRKTYDPNSLKLQKILGQL